MKKICVIGSLNMDLIISTPRLPAMGESLIGSGFEMCPGGKGANQAIAASRLGADVTMIGCVGDDIFGDSLTQNLEKNGVCAKHVKKLNGVSTGVAQITLKDGDNRIIVDPGANFMLTPELISQAEDEIKKSDMLVMQLEIPQASVELAVNIAKNHGVKVLLNPAPARALSDKLLGAVDILSPNESECEYLSGIKIDSPEDAGKAIALFRGKGVSQVIVTMGAKGVAYNSGDKFMHKQAHKVKAVDTTAAGDSFSAALACMLANGHKIDEAVDYANIVGSLTVAKKGAQPSLPTKEEVWEQQKRFALS